MDRCEVLHTTIGEHLQDLGACIERLSIKSQVPQIEVAVAENNTVLILHLGEIGRQKCHFNIMLRMGIS
jgi:23S rRNA (uracil1939-C5)-methyltransferase